MKTKDKGRSLYHWLVVAACCGLSCSSIGIACNCMGIFYTPVSESLGVGRGTIALYSTVINLTGGLMGPFIAKLMEKINFRLMLSGGITVLCLAMASLSLGSSPIYFYIAALFIGFGFSAIGMIPITVIIGNWFAEKHGFATGLALCFSGIGGAIFNPIFSTLIGSIGWRTTYVIAAVLMAAICLPGILFILRLKPEEKGLLPYGLKELPENSPTELKESGTKSKTKIFSAAFLGACFFGLLCAFVTGMGSHFPGLAADLGLEASVGAFMVSAGMVGNVVFKLLLGAMSDKFGAVKSCSIMFIINIAAMLVLMFIPEGLLIIPLLSAFFYGAVFAVSAVGLPLVVKQVFGVKNFSSVYAYVSITGFAGSAFALSIIGFLYDIFGGYNVAMYVCLACSVASLVIMNLIALKPKENRI